MRIFIEPLDVLIFRDGRPFTAGEQHVARSLFPPSPLTFYGSIRSKILSEHYVGLGPFKNNSSQWPRNVMEEIGTSTSPGKLSLTGPFLGKKRQELMVECFPIPMDIVKGKSSQQLYQTRPTEKIKIFSDLESELLLSWARTSKPVDEVKGFIEGKELKKYLNGEKLDSYVPLKDVVGDEFERRVGIKLSKTTRTTETGLFYTAEYIRLKEGWGFTLDVHNSKLLPKEGILKIGGEGKAAYYSSVKERDWTVDVSDKIADTKKFKLYLASPAIFEKGWLPSFLNQSLVGQSSKYLKFKLVAACIGKYWSVRGFDLANNRPRPMMRAVPPGSVYYFELLEGDDREVVETFNFKSISNEFREAGFGTTLVGCWNND